MSFKMTREERETFLSDLHVGVIGISSSGRAPVLVPIWYSYQPGGEVRVLTLKGSKKEQLLSQAGRFSLCVQDEAPPYRYVSVEGQIISMEEADHDRDVKPIAVRYLGEKEGAQYVEETRGDVEILVRMRPERWSAADFGK
jgi:nitroimidazol reductase NimA-like FMN-containing flavoprotein (pyridoxamine 5'-phosphate oxidase superfamily)